MIRYDINTLTPYQAIVAIDSTSDFILMYEPITDPTIQRFLSYRHLLPADPSSSPYISAPLLASPLLRKAYTSLPLAPNLSKPDFIPTKALIFMEQLRARLPNHRLLVADFAELPDAVDGRNGPVVQTRYGASMIPCETFLVKQGYFDIFFPTGQFNFLPITRIFRLTGRLDFELLRNIYNLVMSSPTLSTRRIPPTSKPSGIAQQPHTALEGDFFQSHPVRGFRRRNINIYSQADFLRDFGGDEIVRATTVKDGSWVMGGMYGNAKIMF